MAAEARTLGNEATANATAADWIVINTCTVTREAERDSRQKVRSAHARNPAARLALTGCWATMEPERAAAFPGVALVIPNTGKQTIAAILTAEGGIPARARRRLRRPVSGAGPAPTLKCRTAATTLAPTASPGWRAGRSAAATRTGSIADILAAESAGAKEAVLAGVHLGAWGKDLGSGFGSRAAAGIGADAHIDPAHPAFLARAVGSAPGIFRAMAGPAPVPASAPAAAIRLRLDAAPDGAPHDAGGFRAHRGCGPRGDPRPRGDQRCDGRLPRRKRSRVPREPRIRGAHELRAAACFPFLAAARDRGCTNALCHPAAGDSPAGLLARQSADRASDSFARRFLGREMDVLWEADTRCGLRRGLTGNFLRVRVQSDSILPNTFSRVKLTAVDRGEMVGELEINISPQRRKARKE